ncbi:MAG: hypothetical protein GY810_10285 [Aureispira sp.]|nr:hypothetical protein [Aureispira sp.]
MAKKIVKVEERFNNIELVAVFSLLFVLLSVRFTQQQLLATHEATASAEAFTLALLLVGGALFILWRLRMTITLHQKGISFKISPLHTKKYKIKWEEIEKCQLVEISKSAEWSGWGVPHLDRRERVFSLCGKTGLYIKKKDGEVLFLGSMQLSGYQDEIVKLLNQKNIPIEGL